MDTHWLVSALLRLVELHYLKPCLWVPQRCQYLATFSLFCSHGGNKKNYPHPVVCVWVLDKNLVKHLYQKLQSCHHITHVNLYNQGQRNLVYVSQCKRSLPSMSNKEGTHCCYNYSCTRIIKGHLLSVYAPAPSPSQAKLSLSAQQQAPFTQLLPDGMAALPASLFGPLPLSKATSQLFRLEDGKI